MLFYEQLIVAERIMNYIVSFNHIKNPNPVIKLDAMGGTGKTYTINYMLSQLSLFYPKGSVVAFTGRATSHLRQGGIEARTIHSLLYQAVVDDNGDLLYFRERPLNEVLDECGGFIVADEASMIPKNPMDRLKMLGIPIVLVGDFFQLPAIDKDNPGYNALLDEHGETLTLYTNRRVDPNSAGIRQITDNLRKENTLPRFGKFPGVHLTRKNKIQSLKYHEDNQFDAIICGMNKTRKTMNELVRSSRGYEDDIPAVGEIVMCTKNNIINGVSINNGESFEVNGIFPDDKVSLVHLRNTLNNDTVYVKVYNETWKTETIPSSHNRNAFNAGQFVFGYAMTCHKSQGASIQDVLFIDEDVSFFLDHQRFRYTGCSRASKQLYIAF